MRTLPATRPAPSEEHGGGARDSQAQRETVGARGEPADAASHFTNRSPYPMIHFLREEMMERVLEDFPNPEQIPQRNIKTLEGIGRAEIEKRWNRLK